MKRLFSLIIILTLLISCGKQANQSTSPDNNNELKIITEGQQTVNYGSKSSLADVSDKAKLNELWKTMVGSQTVYYSADYSTESGKFDAEANYYDITNAQHIRTKFINCAVYSYNKKIYLAGVYWDNNTGTGMEIRYRLIIVDEKGAEQAWYGGVGDENVLPNENTTWTKYNSTFGYLKNY